MPMYKKRSYGRKRTFKRRAGASWLTRYQPRAMAINRQAPGLGRSLKTKLKTTFFYNATHVSGALPSWWSGVLNLGSIHDPCGSLANVQPAGYDQLKTLYARYLVTGATVKITFTGNTETQNGVATSVSVAAAYPTTVQAVPTTFEGFASQPYAQSVMYTNEESKTMYFKLNAQKVIGSRLPPNAEDSGALVNEDPAVGQNMILAIMCQGHITATDPGFRTVLKIDIVQDVIFDQRIQVVDA